MQHLVSKKYFIIHCSSDNIALTPFSVLIAFHQSLLQQRCHGGQVKVEGKMCKEQ